MGRAAEEEKYSNDDNEEEEEARQHDEKHKDVKKEEAEEERKCHARCVYLGHLCLHPHWRPYLAVFPALPLSQSPISPYCSSTSQCSTLPFPGYFCLAWMLMAGHESLNTLNGSII